MKKMTSGCSRAPTLLLLTFAESVVLSFRRRDLRLMRCAPLSLSLSLSPSLPLFLSVCLSVSLPPPSPSLLSLTPSLFLLSLSSRARSPSLSVSSLSRALSLFHSFFPLSLSSLSFLSLTRSLAGAVGGRCWWRRQTARPPEDGVCVVQGWVGCGVRHAPLRLPLSPC